ncbi:MAG: RdgB/HAM1 family non-canonical purine NTP pyrophosphatase [Verrucomicrobiales bacterium]
MANPPPLLLIATANRHKTEEFRALLDGIAAVEDLTSHPHLPQVEETGTTFEDNSAIKAIAAARATGLPALADDSGLEVDALGGEPGVHSARYSGVGATDASNRHKLLGELARLPESTARSARFRCVLTLASPAGEILGSWSGSVEGRIIGKEQGGGGFGYDPLFIPDGHEQTFAELPAETKNKLSHRGRATAAFLADRAQWSL